MGEAKTIAWGVRVGEDASYERRKVVWALSGCRMRRTGFAFACDVDLIAHPPFPLLASRAAGLRRLAGACCRLVALSHR